MTHDADAAARPTEARSGEPTAPAEGPQFLARVLVTGASGFVGGYVVRELVARGHTPVCLVRNRERFLSRMSQIPKDRLEVVPGSLFDAAALAKAAEGAHAAIHLVGIITEQRWRGQTFRRIHAEGTQRVVDVCKAAGVRRLAHMSALGTRLHAVAEYHRTKWLGECHVRDSGLDWTIFRPSIIHGHDGEFMRMMRVFMCDATVASFGWLPTPFPVIPYFGDGQARVQPVSVRDVAHCFVAALSKPETIGRTFDLGGPEPMTWKELYRVCREKIPGAKSWKPMVGQPVFAAKLAACTVMKLPILPRMLRFDVGQVQMSQEDAVCDVGPVEQTFGIKLRDFRRELGEYAALIE